MIPLINPLKSAGVEEKPKQSRKPAMDDVSRIVWTQCLGARFGENALILSDKAHRDIARSLLQTGRNFCRPRILPLEGMKMHGQEPPRDIAEAMLESDIIIAPTTFSITHTDAALQASRNGSRIITMPGITRDIYLRSVPVDYRELCARGEALMERLRGREVKIETRTGTDLYLRIEGRKLLNNYGVAQDPGKILNLPDGEVGLAPLEGRSEGKLVIDGSCAPDSATDFGTIGLVKKPFRITVEGGEMVDCENDILWKIITNAEHGTNLAELGIGTNPKAMLTGIILEDEKVFGTAHIAFGTNKDLGGLIQSSVHLDAVFRKPTIEVDGEIIILEGKF